MNLKVVLPVSLGHRCGSYMAATAGRGRSGRDADLRRDRAFDRSGRLAVRGHLPASDALRVRVLIPWRLPFLRSDFVSVSFCGFTTPLLNSGLSILSGYMDKAIAYVETSKIDPAALFGARLAPDIFPLSRQVQSACDKAKNGVARLTGVTAPSFQDTESTFQELKMRIAKTVTFLNSATGSIRGC
jgi:hypothetical protein